MRKFYNTGMNYSGNKELELEEDTKVLEVLMKRFMKKWGGGEEYITACIINGNFHIHNIGESCIISCSIYDEEEDV